LTRTASTDTSALSLHDALPILAQLDAASSESTSATSSEFENLVREIPQGSLPKRAQTIKALAATHDERVTPVIEALQQGNLYADRQDPPLVAISSGSGKFIDALTGEAIAMDNTEQLKRVPITN